MNASYCIFYKYYCNYNFSKGSTELDKQSEYVTISIHGDAIQIILTV